LVQTLAASDAAETLSAAGWQPASGLVHFQLAGVAAARRAGRALLTDDVEVELRADLTEPWLADDTRALSYRDAATAVLCGPEHVAFAAVHDEAGAVVAKGRAALSEGADVWVGVTDLWVAPDNRREGLGSVILDRLLGWAAERGAGTVFLNVTDGNDGGTGLYERLGFVTHHTNRYFALER
jgi:GNAT superfamily N-acetyltransferase